MSLLLLGTGRGPYAVDSTLVWDTFTDSSGVALTTHTPDKDFIGNGWVFGIGTWDIESNRAEYTTGSDGVNNVLIDTGSSRYTVTADINTGTAGYIGFIVRAASSNSNIEVLLRTAEDDVQIGRNDGGSRASLSTGAVTIDGNTVYEFAATVTTAAIEVSVDGSTVASASTNFNSSETRVGLFVWDSAEYNEYWDDFLVTR